MKETHTITNHTLTARDIMSKLVGDIDRLPEDEYWDFIRECRQKYEAKLKATRENPE